MANDTVKSIGGSSIPSGIFEHYCTPIGNDGKFLCDTNGRRGLAAEEEALEDVKSDLEMSMMMSITDPTSVEDWGWATEEVVDSTNNLLSTHVVENPEEQIVPEGGDRAATDYSTQSPVSIVQQQLPIVTQEESSPERFPILFGGVLIISSFAFTIFTLVTVFKQRRGDEEHTTSSRYKRTESVRNEATPSIHKGVIIQEGKSDDGFDAFLGVLASPSMESQSTTNSHTTFVNYLKRNNKETTTSSPGDTDSDTVNSDSSSNNLDAREEQMKEMANHNSWVFGRQSSSLQDVPLNDIESGDEKTLLSWKDLSCTYPSKKSGGNDITTISEVTGEIQYKELVAIMGPSGGGKSTLMDILSGRKSLGSLGGEMSLLGQTMTPKSTDCKDILRDVVAYVPQNEQFFPNQTPEEAVAFVADLKLGKDERGDHVRKKRIDQVLDLVGIPTEARRRSIGGTLAGGMVIRGLSGGERKRLALACAVAMKPSLLFFDEITSGLDSENAVMVIDLIKKMCVYMNVAAVVVIHQPSYEVFEHFDRLILLSKGKCVYADKLDQMQSFYDRVGRSMPEKYLIPNDVLNIASNWDDYNNITTSLTMQPNNELAETCGVKLLQDIKARKKPSAFLQFKTVLLRQLMNHYVRNVTNLLARLMIYGLVAVLLGAVFWDIAKVDDGSESLSPTQAQASFGAGIFITQVFYLLPFAQISTFFFDKNLFASESSIGLYPAWIYSFSQIILELWVMVLCALVETAIAVPMMSLWNPSLSKMASFLSMFTVFCVGGVVGNSLVMLTSIMVSSQDLAFLVGSANTVIFLSMSGGFVPFTFMQEWIVWLQWVSPIKYSFQGFTWSLLRGTPTSVILEELELDTPPNATSNIGILVGVFALCAAGSALALARQKEVR